MDGPRVCQNYQGCYSAGVVIHSGDFCTSCGREMSNKLNVCLKGHEMYPGWRYCNICGSPPATDKPIVEENPLTDPHQVAEAIANGTSDIHEDLLNQ